MVPTMILFGLLLGRWWRSALIVGTVAWTVLLWTEGLLETPPEIVGAATLAFANTAVGVIVHHVVLATARRAGRPSLVRAEAQR